MAFLYVLELSVVYSTVWYCVCLRRNAMEVVVQCTSSFTHQVRNHITKLCPEMVLVGMAGVS